MRIFATILALVLGTGLALAQNDPKTQPGADKAKVAAKATHRRAAAKPKQPSAEKKDAKPEAADKDDKAAANPDTADKDKPSKDKGKRKSAKAADKDAPVVVTPELKASLRDAYATIPPAERAALQSDLIWTGDYNGLIDGQLSDRLIEAVMTYQKRQKGKPTGLLSASERAALTAAVRPTQEEAGWRVIDDPVTGARVGLPSKLATKTAPGPSGTRWSSAQGQLQIETFRIDTGASLEAVFEQQKKMPRRRVTYNVLKPDFFVVSGMQGLKKFYVRAFAQNGQVRGIAILYDQAMEGTMDPMVVAMSSAFVPFASYAAASAAGVPRRKVEYGTGVVVSPSGHVVTARTVVDGCQVITIPGLGPAERLVDDKDSGVALLRVYGASKLVPIQLHGGIAETDSVTLVGIADPQAQGGGDAVTTAPAKLADGALDPAPAPGFAGAAALDGQGRLLGIAVQKSAVVAGLANTLQGGLVPIAQLRALLDANYIAPAAGGAGLDGAKAAAVRVICVRK